MKIRFCLVWLNSKHASRKSFKFAETHSLFTEYLRRISKFLPCEASGSSVLDKGKAKGAVLWICDRGRGSKMLSTEELADSMQKLLDQGARELQIAIGGPDGFSSRQLQGWSPDLSWSFGPLTLPHELASVIACEQIYRALTILHHLPYHAGH